MDGRAEGTNLGVCLRPEEEGLDEAGAVDGKLPILDGADMAVRQVVDPGEVLHHNGGRCGPWGGGASCTHESGSLRCCRASP